MNNSIKKETLSIEVLCKQTCNMSNVDVFGTKGEEVFTKNVKYKGSLCNNNMTLINNQNENHQIPKKSIWDGMNENWWGRFKILKK